LVNLITLGTKVDNSVAEKFQNMCNDDGITTSEELRNLITMAIDAHEDYLKSKNVIFFFCNYSNFSKEFL